jgi:hypothetical protein
LSTFFPTIAHEEGWLGGVIRTLHGDFVFFKLMAIELAQLGDTIPITKDPLMRESMENRVREIHRTIEIRRGAQEDVVRDAMEKLETTQAMRDEKNRIACLDAMSRRTTAQEVLHRAGRDLDVSPTPRNQPVPEFLRQPQV